AIGQFAGNFSLRFDLNVIADPSEQIVGGSRCPPGARGDLCRARGIDIYAQQTRAPDDDLLHFVGSVVIEPRRHPESRTQRRTHLSCAGGCADPCEFRQLDSKTPRLPPLTEYGVEL